MRMIDKDELIAFIKANGYVYANTLDTFPEVDAVPVVRCRECKHYQTDVLFNHNYCCGRIRKPDDYCSYGERRETKWS